MIRKQSNTRQEHEQYSPGYGNELIQSYQRRDVRKEAAFLSQHLRPGMNLLDCGCGPGTITVGLASLVAPGKVVGIDKESGQIEASKAHANDQKVTNVKFKIASAYDLPFDDSSFDVVFGHALLQHLNKPIDALKQMHRVLKPRGIIGVRDDDQGGLILAPRDPKMERLIWLLKQFMRQSGGNPSVGRQHRQLLRAARFKNVVGSATCECDGTYEATKKRGDIAAELVTRMTDTAVEMGWASADEMKEMALASRAWGENADAFDAIIWCEAVGRKP